jgi:hypothetical protein
MGFEWQNRVPDARQPERQDSKTCVSTAIDRWGSRGSPKVLEIGPSARSSVMYRRDGIRALGNLDEYRGLRRLTE